MFRTVEWDLIGSVNATALSATNPNEWCAKRDFLELDRRGQRQPSTTTSGIAASLFQLQHLIGGPFAVNSTQNRENGNSLWWNIAVRRSV